MLLANNTWRKVFAYSSNVCPTNGMSYGDCVEQLTCLLFLKMADEPTAL